MEKNNLKNKIDLLKEEIKNNYDKTNLSNYSKNVYIGGLVKLCEMMNIYNIKKVISQPKKLIDKLNELYSNPNTKKNKLGSILSYMNLLELPSKEKKLYLEEVEKLNKSVVDKLRDNIKNEKEELNWITDEDIKKIDNYYKKKLEENKLINFDKYKIFRDYVIFKTYDRIPSRLDFADTKLIYYKKDLKMNDDINYLILNKKNKQIEYILNTYKTSRMYGQKIIRINDTEFYNLLVDYKTLIDKLKFDDEEWFLYNDSMKKMNRNRLSHYYTNIGKCIGKNITVSLNRHKKISDIVPIKEMKDLADIMGNSVNEQVNVYSKV